MARLNKSDISALESQLRKLTPSELSQMSTAELTKLARQSRSYVNQTITQLEKSGLRTRESTAGLNKVKATNKTMTRRQALSQIKRGKQMAYNPLRSPQRIRKIINDAGIDPSEARGKKYILGPDGRPQLVDKDADGKSWAKKTFKAFEKFKKYMQEKYNLSSDQVWDEFLSLPDSDNYIDEWEARNAAIIDGEEKEMEDLRKFAQGSERI